LLLTILRELELLRKPTIKGGRLPAVCIISIIVMSGKKKPRAALSPDGAGDVVRVTG
jgi:hypothetical protein